MTEPNNDRLVSVIVPVYNCHEFLKECLDSLRNQSYANIEVIVIDDGSSDGSDIIAREFVDTDSRFTLIRQPNKGLGASRNRGIDAANGNWIMFVDADDILLPHAVDNLLSAAAITGAKLVLGKIKKLEHPVYKRDCESLRRHNSRIRIYNAPELTEIFYYQHIKGFSLCGSLFDRQIFSKGLRFPVNCFYEDLAITHLLFERAETIAQFSQTTYIYRQHPHSFIHSFSMSRFDVLDVTDEIYNHFSQGTTPTLMKAAADRRFSAHCNMLLLIWRNKKAVSELPELENYHRRCISVIRQHRKSTLINPKVRLKNRLGALLSYNLPLIRFLFYIL